MKPIVLFLSAAVGFAADTPLRDDTSTPRTITKTISRTIVRFFGSYSPYNQDGTPGGSQAPQHFLELGKRLNDATFHDALPASSIRLDRRASAPESSPSRDSGASPSPSSKEDPYFLMYLDINGYQVQVPIIKKNATEFCESVAKENRATSTPSRTGSVASNKTGSSRVTLTNVDGPVNTPSKHSITDQASETQNTAKKSEHSITTLLSSSVKTNESSEQTQINSTSVTLFTTNVSLSTQIPEQPNPSQSQANGTPVPPKPTGSSPASTHEPINDPAENSKAWESYNSYISVLKSSMENANPNTLDAPILTPAGGEAGTSSAPRGDSKGEPVEKRHSSKEDEKFRFHAPFVWKRRAAERDLDRSRNSAYVPSVSNVLDITPGRIGRGYVDGAEAADVGIGRAEQHTAARLVPEPSKAFTIADNKDGRTLLGALGEPRTTFFFTPPPSPLPSTPKDPAPDSSTQDEEPFSTSGQDSKETATSSSPSTSLESPMLTIPHTTSTASMTLHGTDSSTKTSSASAAPGYKMRPDGKRVLFHYWMIAAALQPIMAFWELWRHTRADWETPRADRLTRWFGEMMLEREGRGG